MVKVVNPPKRKKSKAYRTISILVLLLLIALYPFLSAFNTEASLSTEAIEEIIDEKKDVATVVSTSTVTATSTSTTSPILRDDILEVIYSGHRAAYGADNVWYDIMMKGKEIMNKESTKDNDSSRLRAFEVGAHSGDQTLIAAKAGFHAYCIEPSPMSFERIQKQVRKELSSTDKLDAKYIHLFQVAAGSDSEGEVDFVTSGGTGDHVGEFDMWNMKAGKPPEEWPEHKKGKVVKVPSKRLDDFIYNKVKPNVLDGLEAGSNPPDIDRVFALKVDTQGFEPHVFDGLTESIKNHKINYIMTEYWPNGMGLLTGKDKCEAAVGILTQLIESGYTLYALPLNVHPKGKNLMNNQAMADWKSRPLHDLKADCQYILDLEKRFPVEDYHMGFWTDVLAVAPGSEPIEPKTFGKV